MLTVRMTHDANKPSLVPTAMTSPWAEFYRRNAERYAQVAESGLQSEALDSSHPQFRGDWDLVARLTQLAPGTTGLDAGCGSGARDVRRLLRLGCDMTGIDAVKEAVRLTHKLCPDLRRRVFTADLREPLPFGNEAFDFALCVSVLQHIDPEVTYQATLPELVRVLRPGGVLLLAFKRGTGTARVYDHHYREERHFLLYDEREVLHTLNACGMGLILGQSSDDLGGLLYCTDVKGLRYCALFARKNGVAGTVSAKVHLPHLPCNPV